MMSILLVDAPPVVEKAWIVEEVIVTGVGATVVSVTSLSGGKI